MLPSSGQSRKNTAELRAHANFYEKVITDFSDMKSKQIILGSGKKKNTQQINLCKVKGWELN